jgi:hypothetical protein
MTNLRENYWAVEVPEDADQIEVCNYGSNDTIEWVHKIHGINAYRVDDLPPGTWQVICTNKDATIDQAQQIVEAQDDGFKDYNKGSVHRNLPYMSPFDSLRSLIEAKGLRGKNYLIIQKILDGK